MRESEVAQSCPTSDPMDFSLPGSSVHGIFQAKVLEWGAIAFSDTTAAGIVKAVSVALENWLGYTRFFKTNIYRCNFTHKIISLDLLKNNTGKWRSEWDRTSFELLVIYVG